MKFTSDHKGLLVMAENKKLQFVDGVFETEDEKEIELLKRIPEVDYELEEKQPIVKPLEALNAGDQIKFIDSIKTLDELKEYENVTLKATAIKFLEEKIKSLS